MFGVKYLQANGPICAAAQGLFWTYMGCVQSVWAGVLVGQKTRPTTVCEARLWCLFRVHDAARYTIFSRIQALA